ncbi:MAG: DUF433 domain-containing protein [Ktedonobacteraceae bacterium]|nr:DUF433 domain-containing protein [Ktedonobacteraceae bacterium]
MKQRADYTERIIIDPKIMVGKPVVKGTRVLVEVVLERLAENLDVKTLFEDYPRLTEEDVKACLTYAEAVIEGEDVFSIPQEHPSAQV